VLELIAHASGEDIEITPGSDLTRILFETEIDPGEPVAVIGGTAETIEMLRARYGLQDVRWCDAPMGLRSDPRAVEACADFAARNPARFTFICVGSPQQEMVARAIKGRGDCTGIGLCVGASLEFLTGETARAPRWMQRARLEWLHRLAAEPRRLWRRYLVDGPKILLVWRRWRRERARVEAVRAEAEQRLRAHLAARA
jgi:exopolysaccharide biosynthesis WecB/TagA/CpsF family protein